MSNALRRDGSVAFFYSNEGPSLERMRVHIRRGGGSAKIWLEPEVKLHIAYGMTRSEARDALNLVTENLRELKDAWNDYFGR